MAKELKKQENNPAISWLSDPKHQLFFAYFKDPQSPTFGNVKQSALRAGFAPSYAHNITGHAPDWLCEIMRHQDDLVALANKNFKEHLTLPMMTQAMGPFGPIFETIKEKVQCGTFKNGSPKFKTVKKKVPVMVYNASLIKERERVSEFIAETLGKTKYNKKTGDEGVTNNVFIFANEQRTRIAARIIGGRSTGDTSGEE